MSFRRYLRQYGIAAFLLVVTSSAVAAENPPVTESSIQIPDAKTASVELNRDYFMGYLTDTGTILTSPAHWNASDWFEAALVTGVAVGLYTQDDKIQTWVQKHKN